MGNPLDGEGLIKQIDLNVRKLSQNSMKQQHNNSGKKFADNKLFPKSTYMEIIMKFNLVII